MSLEIESDQGYDYVKGVYYRKKNYMNNLSRNRPVAFVVGAAGFIGSHLTEKLLEKRIQVVGCDNFFGDTRNNLIEASKDKNFHLISQPLTEITDFDLPRIDYAVFIITEDIAAHDYESSFKKFLEVCLDFKPKVILCSSINLYDAHVEEFNNLKEAEKKLAKVTLDKKINARVVRLAAVFGPRMNFRDSDPMIRLIKSAVQNKLNQEQTPLEFTTRALYISDAVDLLIKTIMHGFTAQKIYDGCLLEPIKVAEIKQLLLDPVWYEEKGFLPTELPPWSTPNLNKTIKELSWKPHISIITALKQTLIFFKDHPDAFPKDEIVEKKQSIPWQFSKLEEEKSVLKIESFDKKKNGGLTRSKISLPAIKHQAMITIGLIIIFFAIIFPVLKFSFYLVDIKANLENSIQQTSQGNFDEALKESNQAVEESQYLMDAFNNLSFIQRIEAVKTTYQTVAEGLRLTNVMVKANLHTISGAKLLANAFSVISGEKAGESTNFLSDAKTEFATANSEIGEVTASLSNKNFTNQVPSFLQQELILVDDKVNSFGQIIKLGETVTNLLPQIIATEGEKSYLIVLQDNRILRPGGGVIRSYAKVTFNNGKLKEIKGDMVENLDSSYNIRIDPPFELKNDLGISNWRLKDAAVDPDFPISAQNIAWFFNKESGTNVSGVIMLDLTSISKLFEAVGPLKIGNNQDEINGSNLMQKVALGRDGNQVSADILKILVERIFYLSKRNWVVLAKNSEVSLSQKDLLVYLSDPNAFSYLSSNGLAGNIITPIKEKIGERNESLMLSETNMTQGQDSTAIKRSINIESKLDISGTISHKLTIGYEATETLTGPYKNRLKVYLPGGTKMIKTTWGNNDIKDVSSFSDYGMSGYSMLLTLGMGEQKQLIMEYQDLIPAKFDNNQLKYSLNIIKQVGQEAIPVDFKLTFPEGIKVESNLQNGMGEVSAKDQLTQDKNFEVVLRK